MGGENDQIKNSLDVVRLSGALGAEVRGLSLASVDEAQVRQIESLLWEHQVLFFPDQHLSDEAQVAFGRRFGRLENHPHLENPTSGLPEALFELAASHGGVADEWHTDLTFLESPALYSILHMLKSPSVGGDTMWLNPAQAYDELSPPIQALCCGLSAIHTAEAHGRPDEQVIHPVVRVHPETGRRVLNVNEHFTKRIVELSHVESDLLLGHLWSFMASPRFTVRYRWTEGTVAMWDNRGSQHFVLNDFDEERVIRRVTVMGDQVEAAEPSRWPSFSRLAQDSDTSRHDAILNRSDGRR